MHGLVDKRQQFPFIRKDYMYYKKQTVGRSGSKRKYSQKDTVYYFELTTKVKRNKGMA